MSRQLQAMFWWIVRCLVRLRYRVRVVGLEKLGGVRGPTLVMPNHPGYIDPPLVLSHLRLEGPVRPIVTEAMYRRAALLPWMRLVEALEVPELDEHSHGAREQTLAMIDAVVEGLQRGESFLLYPSGRAQRRGLEQVGAARAAAQILQRCPQANVVLVRTRGVWGSMFSYARTGGPPNLARCVVRGVGWMLANLLVLAPRREVTIAVEPVDRDELPGLDREWLNPFLEAWYNAEGPEKPTFVPYHFLFGPREYRFPDLDAAVRVDVASIKPAAIEAVFEMIEEHLGRELTEEEKQPESTLDQLGLDSLERMEIALKIEDRFGFRTDRVADTLGELWALADGMANRDNGEVVTAPPLWWRPPKTTEPAAVVGETLGEAFVRRILRHPDDMAVADRLSGALSYRRLLIGSRLLGKRLAALADPIVGVMLPASVAADVVFFGLQLAGKLPAMLNWTTGPGNLAHVVEKLGITRVVTSRKMVDRLGIEVRGAEYVFVEDLRADVGRLESLSVLLATYLSPGSFLRNLPMADPDEAAVVLFTSGSESTPKAVPLTHRNLITNVRAAIPVLALARSDSLLAFLPPFHSFGLMGNVLAPILSGVRAVHHPDPTDAAALVRTTAAYRATIMVTTPTFLSYMFAVAGPEDLVSLRVIVTGAEKCPEALFDRASRLAPAAKMIEGYGITECSPVVAGNLLHRIKRGTVGPPVEGVEICVVDPDTKRPLPPDTLGILLVRGPSVFAGYWQYDGADPFVEVDGKHWYYTGDLVRVDDDGYIHFCGRLKRFLKAGGEMISLPALEEPLVQHYPSTDEGPQVAIEGIERPDGRLIVLFTTRDISLRQANSLLAEAGFRGVMRIDEVRRVEAIPVLGTGKTDYKVLRGMLAEKVAGPA